MRILHQLVGLVSIIIFLGVIVFGIYLALLAVKALRKYIHSQGVHEETKTVKKPLADALKEKRILCKMTQEFVSDAIGVSRQAVSKWENGSAVPSTSNLTALAKLYGVPAEELLKNATK